MRLPDQGPFPRIFLATAKFRWLYPLFAFGNTQKCQWVAYNIKVRQCKQYESYGLNHKNIFAGLASDPWISNQFDLQISYSIGDTLNKNFRFNSLKSATQFCIHGGLLKKAL